MSLAQIGKAFGIVALLAPFGVWAAEPPPLQPSATRWSQVVAAPGADEYIDLSSIEQTGTERRVETLTDLKEPAPADGALRPYYSRIVERVIDCKGRRFRALRMVLYGNRMAAMEVNRLDFTKVGMSDWKALPVDAGSIGDIYFQAVCQPDLWDSRKARWTPVMSNAGGVQVSFAAQPGTGSASPLRIRALVVSDSPRPQPGQAASTYQSVIMTAEADCAGTRMRALAVSYYTMPDPVAMLPAVMNTNVPHEWRPISDKGAFDVAIRSACSKQSASITEKTE